MIEDKKKRKDHTFWLQCNEKPSILLGCPCVQRHISGGMRTGEKSQVVKQQVEGSGHEGSRIIGAIECTGSWV